MGVHVDDVVPWHKQMYVRAIAACQQTRDWN
jgi:hypothetical protein